MVAGLREKAVEAVLRSLKDSNDLVQIEAARTLTRWADARPQVLDGLCDLIRSSNPAVQAQAAQALGKIGAAATAVCGDVAQQHE